MYSTLYIHMYSVRAWLYAHVAVYVSLYNVIFLTLFTERSIHSLS